MSKLMASFLAFNANAFNNLFYLVETNLASLLIIGCAAAFVFLYLHEEIVMSVREEQNIL